MPEKKLKIQNFFEVVTTGTIPLSWDAVFTVSVAPANTRGFIVVSPNNLAGREIMFYNSTWNTLTVKAENRWLWGTTVWAHALNEPVALKDVAEIFNFFSDNVSQAFFVEKTGGLNVEVWGWFVNYNWALQEVIGSTFTLADNATNYLKYDYPTNTLSVSTSSWNNKAIITTSSGAITSIVYQIAKESFIDFSVTLNGALPNQTWQQGKVLWSDWTNAAWVSKNDYAVDSGTANTYIATIPGFQLSAWSEVDIKITNANTGASTININGAWVKSIKKNVSSDMSSWDILAWEIIKLIYDGTNFQMVSDIPAAVASNLKNSEYIAGEALTTWNAVVVEQLDKLNTETVYINSQALSQSTPSTSIYPSMNQYYWMAFTTSVTKYLYSFTMMSWATIASWSLWRLTRDWVWVIASGSFDWWTFWDPTTVITPIQIVPWNTYRLEMTYTSWWWSAPYRHDISLPVTTAPITWAAQSVNWASQITTPLLVQSISLYDLDDVFWNIGDISSNTRYDIAWFWTWSSSNSVNLLLRRVWTPSNLWVRIETDNAWVPSGTLVHPNATVSIVYTGITTSKSNITVTFPWNFTLNANTKYHIVLFQWTYWSETVNPSSYYAVAYSNDLTAQITRRWSWSAWSWNMLRRSYISSPLLNSFVLKKSNATTSYWAYCDWVVESAFTEWQQVTMVTAGRTNSITWLTPRTKYYLSNTPGAIATSAWSTVRAIGTASASWNLDIWFYLTT